jgi:hypothetical protein
MALTKDQCQAFMENQTVNPLTGRKIEFGKATFQKLIQECSQKLKPNINPPPMGPLIYWDIGDNKKEEHCKTMGNYIKTRLIELEKSTEPLSKMEMEEFKDICHDIARVLDNDKATELCSKLIQKTLYLEKTRLVVDDRPAYKVISDIQVKPKREFIREKVARIYKTYTYTWNVIEHDIKIKEFVYGISSGTIRDLKNDKKYLDYLVEHNVFSYDDIYKKTFKSEKVFDELAEKYKIYRKIYKEVHGKSPI